MMILGVDPFPKAGKRPEDSRREDKELPRRGKKKMQSTRWAPYGALQAHSLVPTFPVLKRRLPHLLLFRAFRFQVRL